MFRALICCVSFLISMSTAVAQDMVSLARMMPEGSHIKDRFSGETVMTLNMSQRVPYRIFTLAEPNRLVFDFSVLGFEGMDAAQFQRSNAVLGMEFGAVTARKSRLVLELATPLRVTSAIVQEQPSKGQAQLTVRMVPTSQDAFLAKVEPAVTSPLNAQTVDPKLRPDGSRLWVVALDPGHGGVDPGADGGRRSEADLMLLFAFELRDALRTTGDFDVVLTREDDSFVGLEDRMTRARQAGADLFLSLHADAVVEGYAEGLTTYILSNTASSEADQKLAARHNRADILAGVDLHDHGDDVATILQDLVRRETTPRSRALAQHMVAGVRGVGGVVNSNPLRQGDFSVLRSADLPSVLVELGFLSSPADLERLMDVRKRGQIIRGLVDGLSNWVAEDDVKAELLRQ